MQDVIDRKRSPEHRTTSLFRRALRPKGEPDWLPGRLQVHCLICGDGLPNGTDSEWLASWWFRNHIRTRHGGKRRHLEVVPS